MKHTASARRKLTTMRANRVSLILASAVAVVVLLSGCAGRIHPAASASVSVAPTPTPSPTVAAAPTSRVPATCAELVPQALADAAAGTSVQLYTPMVDTFDPVVYADARAGVLDCRWSSDPATAATGKTSEIRVSVVPGGTTAAFDYFRGYWGHDTEPGVRSFVSCPGFQCAFGAILGGYAMTGSVLRDGGTSGADLASARALYERVHDAVAAFPAPAPLWEPPGGSLNGVFDPEGFVPMQQLRQITGIADLDDTKAEGGEYAVSAIGAATTVGAYWASYGGGDVQQDVALAVLPGGAPYFAEAESALDPAAVQRVGGLGDGAYLYHGSPNPNAQEATFLNVRASNSWLQVSSISLPAETLKALAQATLANLGYSG